METTSTPRNRRAIQSPFRLAPRQTLATLGIAAGIFGLWLIQFENLNIFSLTMVVALFLIGIWFKAGWSIYLVIATLVLLRFAFAPYSPIQPVNLIWMDLLFAGVAIVFSGLCFRFLELAKFIRAFHPDLGKPAMADRELRFAFPSMLGGRWWLIPVAVLGATALLFLIPHDGSSTRRYWITPPAARLIFITFFLFFFWFVCRSVIALLMRWRMEPEQADIQVRSMIAGEFWVDQFPVESRRLKIRSRNIRT